MMNNGMPGMMPFDPMSFYEQPKPRFLFKMPRVVPEQKAKFESDDLFRRLSRESEVRYAVMFCHETKPRKIKFICVKETVFQTKIACQIVR